jgi:hypothetical protein
VQINKSQEHPHSNLYYFNEIPFFRCPEKYRKVESGYQSMSGLAYGSEPNWGSDAEREIQQLKNKVMKSSCIGIINKGKGFFCDVPLYSVMYFYRRFEET